MGFGNAKRMDLVKKLMKEEKKKAKDRSLSRTGSSYSVDSRRSMRSSSTGGSSDDPFRCKRVIKIQKFWEMAKGSNDPAALGEAFLNHVMPESPDKTKCQTLVETLDCIIYLLGPDMDQEDLAEFSSSFQGIPTAALADAFGDCLNACLGGTLTAKDTEVVDNAMGMVLRDMIASN